MATLPRIPSVIIDLKTGALTDEAKRWFKDVYTQLNTNTENSENIASLGNGFAKISGGTLISSGFSTIMTADLGSKVVTTSKLSDTGVLPTSYGSSTTVAAFTVDLDGRITSASNLVISGTSPGGSASGDLSGSYPSPSVIKVQGVSISSTNATALSNLTGTNSGDQTISDATISTTDITTNNVSTSKHGFAPKLPNDATKFLDGTGDYSTPAGSGTVTSVATGTGLTGGTITSSGTVSMVSNVSASAYNSVATTLATSAFTKITLGTTLYDQGSYFSTVDSKYTPLVAGKYIVSWNMGIGSSTSVVNTIYGNALFKNGSAVNFGTFSQNTIAGGGLNMSGSAVVSMNGSTDYLELYGYNGNASLTASTNNDATSTYITFGWIGPL